MSKHKAGGSKASQHVNPAGKSLGLKASNGEKVTPGVIIVRQRGTKIMAGVGVKTGRDHTIYALTQGVVKFGQKLGRKFVSVVSK
ncbi:50S ribosomal protein L27 [Candidatus Woesebacteria bacterium]|nr:50S ribosomal protein L27 [Candidatus Woesebacteria bacterium]